MQKVNLRFTLGMKSFASLIFIAVLLMASACQLSSNKPVYSKVQGPIFGTYYHITYLHPNGEGLHQAILDKLILFDASLSTFNQASVISKVNRNEAVALDEFFMQMYEEAVWVSTMTSGAFDITAAPLVNAWGFGFDKADRREEPDVAAILPYVGYEKIRVDDHQLIKTDERILLDASAIAKGQAADVIGALLYDAGCENYMVEIGGEIACKGLNPSGEKWQIGINEPVEDLFTAEQNLQAVLALTDCGMATSGNYRQYYYKNNKKYAHTINPKTGYPVAHNLLSATVIANSCMRADALATAFMVLGTDSALSICERLPDVACYLIYEDENGEFQTRQSSGFETYLSKE